MNDPNKAITVNLSSLLSLKAELQRKQHEVKLAKEINTSANKFKPSKIYSNNEKSKASSSNKDGNYTEISRKGNVKVYESEDYGQLDKSRRVLEAKSKYYERMTISGGGLNVDDNCLVMFNRKHQEQKNDEKQQQQDPVPHNRLSESSSGTSEDEGNAAAGHDDDDEVEYTDCLGRTRTCLRKDLREALRRDKQLADSMPERLDQTKANWLIDTKGTHDSDTDADDDEPSYGPKHTESVYSEALSTMTKHDEQRVNWERKEQENFDKPDVHYQDVFFDEARTHGVGYYAFSTDETERTQQQRELEEARKETQAEQKRRDDLRAERDRIIANRVLAAKNRIRARNGLPAISKEEYEQAQKLKAAEAEIEAREREREQTAKEEKLAAQKAADEAEREKLRKDHVRDWDRDKSGMAKKQDDDDEQLSAPVEWQYKPERQPMSQAQWNEQQRAVRRPEFAPVPETEATPKRLNFSSMPPPMQWCSSDQEFSSYHSTRREKQFQRRNYTKSSDEPNEAEEPISSTSNHDQNQGVTIPPPACLMEGFSGPPASKRTKSQAELERSIEEGLRFLRESCDKGVLGGKASWTSKADY
ncbi:coiled-coil domain-containing protein 174 [Drosophila hydei]|uniref:Coiled-coil domain-containing protein 174 n=1 Tax=Drosophila hydei TaxID=7224 RepID=A0A6J1M9N2_DROHY|nr:coiled-coil domain-containing protein 174 [Drosophila hydei]